jgi:hypothetical protein
MTYGLKFHWSNPKFDGKPWPADSAQKQKKKHPSDVCVKKSYDNESEIAKEVFVLLHEAPQSTWEYGWCRDCMAFHIIRNGK